MQPPPTEWETISGSCDSEKDLGVIEDKQLNLSSQCDATIKRANAILECINGSNDE